MTHPNGTTFEIVKIWYSYGGHVKGVQIHYPCGTRRWISDTWYDEETLKELFAR